MSNCPPYIYVFVRQDLSIAQQAVQGMHAVYEAAKDFKWEGPTPSLIFIGVLSKDLLDHTTTVLGSWGIKFRAFFEPDGSEGLTALCTEVITNQYQRDVLMGYGLWMPVVVSSINSQQGEVGGYGNAG